MRRREYLTATTAAAVAVAGCTEFTDSDEPDDVTEAYYRALDDGDRERANELLHEESEETLTEETMLLFREMEIEVEETAVLEESDDTAEVRVELTVRIDGDEETNEEVHELRTEDGDWKLYE